MPRKIQLMCFLVPLGLLLTATQSGFAQSVNGPLNFGNNYFVTGDYVVAGAQGMNEFFSGGYAIGTITVPDPNPGITGAKAIPSGAEVVAALLYWQTVEKTGTVPGQAGSGENGYFMPVVPGGPKTPGYPITGVELASSDTVAFSSGGCTGSSTGKLVRTYRANVLAALPRDPSGNISANGVYEVFLPSVGNNTPLTLGASLVLIYRILSPSVPLNSVVIYDGAYAPGTSSLTMKQTVQGFYDAASNPVSRLTHIVGGGKSNKFETVYLNNAQVPSLYGREPAFPGYYGTWDNPTWTFSGKTNPIPAGAASATTEVVPSSSQEGCVSWGAVIVSTTVANTSGDGLLDAWKKTPPNYANPGYCDASVNEGNCTPGSASWVDLPGAVLGNKDVFIQLDYLCSSPTGGDSCSTQNGNYSFDPRLSGAVGLVTNAFTANPKVHSPVVLHINPPGTNQADIHAIAEQTCTDAANELCTYPEQPGVVAWKGGFDFIKNQLVDSTSGQTSDCAVASPPATCVPRFQPGRRTSWHYMLSAHAVGEPKWKFPDDSLEVVKQSGTTVTFTTDINTPVGSLNNVNPIKGDFTQDPSCPNGRVTIIGAGSNPNLNGTFCVTSIPSSTSFTITVGGTATTATYTYSTDPNLAVAPGATGTASGVSDVGGADSLVTLGLWGNPASPTSDGQTEPVLAGTFMHELGHSIGLTHGGYTYPLAAEGIYVPTLGPNCKPNFQSVMNYQFQATLLAPSSGGSNVPDYSGQVLASLNKAKAGAMGVLSGTSYVDTYWYTPYNNVGSPVTLHCDGSPNTNNGSASLASGAPSTLSWAADQDINFDGNTTETLQGYDDWLNIDLRQIGATGTNSTAEGGGQNFGGGGQNLGGGGQNLGGGGQNLGGGGQNFGGGGQNLGGGGQNFGGGGQNFGGGGEVNVATINSVTRPPQNAMATEGTAPRYITLNWSAPAFGQIGSYNVYRAVKGSAFSPIASVPAPALTYVDMTASCNATGYEYFITAVLSNTSANPGQESVGSNTVSAGSNAGTGDGPLTGCYTNTPTTVTLNNLAGAPSSVVQGTAVNITWSLQDDYNNTSAYVNNLLTNSLVAIGPFPNDQGCPASLPAGGTTTPLLVNGLKQSGLGMSMYGVSAASPYLFTYSLDTTNLPAGCYWFTLTLDSTQTETTVSPVEVKIFVSGSNPSTPRIATTSLSSGTVGTAYNQPIYESGGTASFTWTIPSGSPPTGITLTGTGNPATLSGTTCFANNVSPYDTFTVMVTDKNGNYGTQALSLQIVPGNTSSSVASSYANAQNTSTYGQAVTFTATVTLPYNCQTTGTVTFKDGAGVLTGGAGVGLTSIGNGVFAATFTTGATQLAAGMHPITAVFSGDSNFIGSTSQTLTQTVSQATTTTSVISSSNASTYGDAVSFTAMVAPEYAGTPTGSVTFYDGAGAISGATPLNTSTNPPTASFMASATLLMAGTHSITAVYSGDSNFYATANGGTAQILYQNVKQATTTTSVSVTSPPSPFTYGQAVTFNALVSPQTAGVPTGSVTFYDGPTPISSPVTLSSAAASFTTAATQLMAGQHSVTAVYGGDGNFFATGSNGSTATALSETLNPAPLTDVVTQSANVFSSTFSGLQGSDTASVIGGTLSCTSLGADGAGNIPIVCSGLSDPNYVITYAYSYLSEMLNSGMAPLTIAVSGTQTYGGTPVYSQTYSGLVNNDSPSVVVTGTLSPCSTSATSTSNIGNSYSISGCSDSSLTATSNYALAPVAFGTLSVTPAPLIANVSYSGGVYSVGSYAGFVNTDSSKLVVGTLSCTATAALDSNNNQPISCTGLSAPNYNVVYNYTYSGEAPPASGNSAPLTVAVNLTQPYGGSPVYSLTYSGFLSPDSPLEIVSNLSCPTNATNTTAPGTAITFTNSPICSGLTVNPYTSTYTYALSYTPGTIATVAPAPLVVVVTGSSPFTASSYLGLVNGDATSVVTGNLSCTVDATADDAGNDPISCSGLSAPSYYTIVYSYAPASVTATPAPLTVAVNGSKVGAQGTPTYTVTYFGFINGDLPADVAGTLSCTTGVGGTALSMPIASCTGLSAPSEYTISYWPGNIKVSP